MSVDQAEFGTLKALLLLQPDLSGLSVLSRDRIRSERDSLIRALFIYLCHRYSPVDASVRQSSLLMLIPSLFNISQLIATNSTLSSLFGFNEDNVFGIGSPQISRNNGAEQLLKMIGSNEMLLAAQLLSQHQTSNTLATSVRLTFK
jgi:hypothetical protein